MKAIETNRAKRPLVRWAYRSAGLGLVWAGLNGSDAASWLVGVPLVLAAARLSLALGPELRWRVTPLGLLSFARFFVVASWRGGLDVARRALSPALRLKPGFVTHGFRLPAGPARSFFCAVINLLPGTLVSRIGDRDLEVHALDESPSVQSELRALEGHVASLFGISPGEAQR